MDRPKSFASLAWYDACIEFLFKLAAKTSEPLLAIGIVYSAADVLSHGHLGYGNQCAQNAWAITQALAIESSGGVMLFMQMIGWKQQTNSPFMLGLFALRCIVSVEYIYLCRTRLPGWVAQQTSPIFSPCSEENGVHCMNKGKGRIYLKNHIRHSYHHRTNRTCSLPSNLTMGALLVN